MFTEQVENPIQENTNPEGPSQENEEELQANQEIPNLENPEREQGPIKVRVFLASIKNRFFQDSAKALELKEMGNQFFKVQDTNQALDYYEQALTFCPDAETTLLLVLYSNIAVCYMKHVSLRGKIKNTFFQKDYESVVEFTTKALTIDCSHIKSLLNRASAYEAQDKPEEALEDYKKLLTVDGKKDDGYIRGKVFELEKKVEQLTEKRKTEVMDGLKKLGNSFLGYFNMSLDNFKMEKNENGSYNISVKK